MWTWASLVVRITVKLSGSMLGVMEVIMTLTSEKLARMLPRQPRGPRGRFQAGQVRVEEEEGEVPARGGSAPAPRQRNRRRIVSPSRSRQPSNSSRRDRSARRSSAMRRRSASRRRSLSARSLPPRRRASVRSLARRRTPPRRSPSRTRRLRGGEHRGHPTEGGVCRRHHRTLRR